MKCYTFDFALASRHDAAAISFSIFIIISLLIDFHFISFTHERHAEARYV